MEKLTAIIPAGNEEGQIDQALESVAFADERIVVDSFSTDRTVEKARAHDCVILQREYQYSAAQKNWAIPQARHEWVLLLDADERITPGLREEILQVLENPQKDAYWIYRQNYLMDRPVRYSGWQNDKVIRLFRRSKCQYEDKMVHAELLVKGRTGRLKNKMEHHTYRGLDHFLEKSYRYTTWGAYNRSERTKRITAFHLLIKPIWAFLHSYFLRLGLLDGKLGLIIALQRGSNLFQRALKIWRIHAGENLKK